MKRIVGLLLILWGLGWLGGQMPSASDAPQQTPSPMTSWRRTCDGWQRAETLWNNHARRPPPVVHPAWLGLGLLLFASAGLIGFSSEGRPAREALRARPTTRR